jgi:hypothetical protein
MPHLSEDFKRVSERRASNALARSVVNEVGDCRGSTYKPIARKRWIWELIQNARDCAKEKPFQFSVSLRKDRLVVCHDAGPFSMAEIVALVEGDSSKPRRSAEQTGKYGKGFLVTHVISTDVQVRGILQDSEGRFSFRFRLNREAPEGAVLQNIADCRDALDAAEPFTGDVCPTEFVYFVSSKEEETRECILDTITALKNHAPYLFAFIPSLRRLTLGIDSECEAAFSLEDRSPFKAANVGAEAERVAVATPDGIRTVLHFTPVYPTDKDRASLALSVFEEDGVETLVSAPTTVARIFQDLPLHQTTDFGLPLVLNLPRQCDVDSDRAMPDFGKDATADAINFGLALVPSIANWAVRERKGGAHRLASLGRAEPLVQNPDADKRWRDFIHGIIGQLFHYTKIVVDDAGNRLTPEETLFPEATWLDFPAADTALLLGTRELLAMRGNKVPSAAVAVEWDEIRGNWQQLATSVKPQHAGLKDLFDEIEKSKSLSVLQTRRPALDDAVKYVCRLFEVTANFCARHDIESPKGLSDAPVILTQSGQFAAGISLSVDDGIDAVLKEISADLGKPFRNRLVNERLTDSKPADFIRRLCNNDVFRQQQAIGWLVTTIETRFSEKQRGPEAEKTKTAAVKLLVWFAGQPADGVPNLRSFPLLCQDDELHPSTETGDAFLAASGMMNEADVAWLDGFPKSVRLSDRYVSTCGDLDISVGTLCDFLTGEAIASSTFLFERQVSSEESFFSGMQSSLQTEAGHRVEGVAANDVAGFTRLLNATGNVSRTGEWKNAEWVIRLVLSRLVISDASWRLPVSATCSGTHKCSGLVRVFPCAWMGKLRTHPWVPAEAGNACEPLNPKNLDRLLDRIGSDLLREAASREFLAIHFGLNPLELALRAKSGDDSEQLANLRRQWAGIVELGVEPQVVKDMVERHRNASAISTRNNRLGKAVEMLVAQALRDEGFAVEPTGVGSDFRAALVQVSDADWSKEDVGEVTVRPNYGTAKLEFLIEVKATCSESVRMSRIQGETASGLPYRYVLCVVDFRNRPEQFDAVIADEDDASIAGCLSLVPDIGLKLAPAVQNLASAVQPASPGIELEKADEIRFRITQQIWKPGQDLKSWAAALRQSLDLRTQL